MTLAVSGRVWLSQVDAKLGQSRAANVLIAAPCVMLLVNSSGLAVNRLIYAIGWIKNILTSAVA